MARVRAGKLAPARDLQSGQFQTSSLKLGVGAPWIEAAYEHTSKHRVYLGAQEDIGKSFGPVGTNAGFFTGVYYEWE